VAPSESAESRLVIAKQVPELELHQRHAEDYMPFLGQLQVAENGAAETDDDSEALSRAVNSLFWYHTIELPGGIVTPGLYDHRPLLRHYGLPVDLSGRRALDVATFDGFWAFQLERRGAEVVAADIDRISQCDFPLPIRTLIEESEHDRQTSLGFELAHEALDSKVTRTVKSVYDLDPAEDGHFDFVHVADLLLHLQDPLRALQAIYSVTRGEVLVADCFDPNIEAGTSRYLGGWANVPWWLPSLETLGQMVMDAGFRNVSVEQVYTLAPKGEAGPGHSRVLLRAES
jgi:tRNA (mo5U34)-methyltransferase